ncbi:HNH endonuclease [Streptomyces sp. NBC_00291]|uniref:HNH endonuclease signature motif containing protein n=1 Tax=Streptomyces sp. NBC_00291 TaxID=2975704 RepID=UPI0022596027|nr:HNH endonuclease signature motif containing protein [Streptomyces sp. NBC_00291]MCX5157644.1 HNH endonuclease [Streptomyces sp. NBC_00291]
MAANRTKVPRPLARQLFVETGHRCAIPTCRATPLEIAHIVPWHRVQRHDFHNMIVLCPNCHTRFDRGGIDRQAMFRYKELLRLPNPNRVAPEDPSPRAGLIRAYRLFQSDMTGWHKAISELVAAVNFSSGGFPTSNLKLARRAASVARASADKLCELGGEGVASAADRVFEWYRSWASEVFDLEPSAFRVTGRDDFEDWAEERFLAFVVLHEELCAVLDMGPTELDFFEAERDERELPDVPLGTRGLWRTDETDE